MRFCSLLAVVLVVAAVHSPTADATFPGANGRIAFTGTADGGRAIYTIRPDGSGLRQIGPVGAGGPHWSPDGKRIAFTLRTEERFDVASMAPDGRNVEIVRRDALAPSYAPDGRRLIYTTMRPRPGEDRPELWSMRTDGTGKRLIMRAGNDPRVIDFISGEYRPDGKRILITGTPSGEHRSALWTIRPDGGDPQLVTGRWRRSGSSYSPDGRRIAVERSDGIEVIRSDGTPARGFSAFGHNPAWSPSGRLIAMVSPCGQIDVISRHGATRPVTGTCASAGPIPYSGPNWQPLPGK